MGTGPGLDQLQHAVAPEATGRALLEDHMAVNSAGLSSSAVRGDRSYEDKNRHQELHVTPSTSPVWRRQATILKVPVEVGGLDGPAARKRHRRRRDPGRF